MLSMVALMSCHARNLVTLHKELLQADAAGGAACAAWSRGGAQRACLHLVVLHKELRCALQGAHLHFLA